MTDESEDGFIVAASLILGCAGLVEGTLKHFNAMLAGAFILLIFGVVYCAVKLGAAAAFGACLAIMFGLWIATTAVGLSPT
jgi:hypothetical protein